MSPLNAVDSFQLFLSILLAGLLIVIPSSITSTMVNKRTLTIAEAEAASRLYKRVSDHLRISTNDARLWLIEIDRFDDSTNGCGLGFCDAVSHSFRKKRLALQASPNASRRRQEGSRNPNKLAALISVKGPPLVCPGKVGLPLLGIMRISIII